MSKEIVSKRQLKNLLEKIGWGLIFNKHSDKLFIKYCLDNKFSYDKTIKTLEISIPGLDLENPYINIAIHKNIDIKYIKNYIEFGNNINYHTSLIKTPLMYATYQNNLPIVNLLLNNGADPNIIIYDNNQELNSIGMNINNIHVKNINNFIDQLLKTYHENLELDLNTIDLFEARAFCSIPRCIEFILPHLSEDYKQSNIFKNILHNLLSSFYIYEEKEKYAKLFNSYQNRILECFSKIQIELSKIIKLIVQYGADLNSLDSCIAGKQDTNASIEPKTCNSDEKQLQ